MTRLVFKMNLFEFNTTGALKVQQDVLFQMCYWPQLDIPTDLFLLGSFGIQVQGPPTPRNVIFPPDTVFLPVLVNDSSLVIKASLRVTDVPTKKDCFYIKDLDTIADVVPSDARDFTSGKISLVQLRAKTSVTTIP